MASRCVKTLFKRQILCAGTMTKYLTIYKSELQATGFNDNQAKPTLTIVESMMGELEARDPTKRFDGIVIDNTFTHVAYISYSQTVYELDLNRLFIDLEATRNRRFKMLGIMNLDEDEKFLAIFVKETGFVNLEAADA